MYIYIMILTQLFCHYRKKYRYFIETNDIIIEHIFSQGKWEKVIKHLYEITLI